jgi:PHD/YefM family antitoxin component YafN of YafNO toxin-antitoxin module
MTCTPLHPSLHPYSLLKVKSDIIVYLNYTKGVNMLNVVDLRKKGIKAINEEIAERGIATLSYRGKPKYVILDVSEYEKLRELELTIAYNRVQEDIKKGNFEVIKSDEDLNRHLKELEQAIKD